MLLQLIDKMVKHLLRSQQNLLIEMTVVIDLKEHQGALSDISVSMFAIEPLLDFLCEIYIIHIYKL